MALLLIKKCPDRLRWYSDLVGQTVPYLGDAGFGEYKSREPAGYINFVQYEDAEIIKDGEQTTLSTKTPYSSKSYPHCSDYLLNHYNKNAL